MQYMPYSRPTIHPALLLVASLPLALGIFLSFTPKILAENLESDSYIIQFGNFNVTAGEKNSASYNVTDTVGQTGAGPYGTYGGTTFVGGGFQYIYQIPDFSFRLSKVAVDLGILTPEAHSTDSHTMTITTRGGGGYTVYAYEIHPLQHSNGVAEIPDTTCDASNCSETTAGVWTNQSVPGFGYNMSGDDVPAAFTDSTYFKQFADDSTAETMQPVMSSSNIASSMTSTVTYKAGISGSQAEGNYETAVVFVAVPGY